MNELLSQLPSCRRAMIPGNLESDAGVLLNYLDKILQQNPSGFAQIARVVEK